MIRRTLAFKKKKIKKIKDKGKLRLMDKIISWEELHQHNKKGDYWICIEGHVYDVTPYLAEHPGGDDVLINNSGKDATIQFLDQNHSEYAVSIRNSYIVGKIENQPNPFVQEITKKPKEIKEYTYEEVAKHNTPEDCWIVIHKKIYDPIAFLNDHPGGPTVITNRAGKDATQAFDEVGHTELAQKQMKDLLVGTIKEGSVPLEGTDEGAADKLNIKQVMMLVLGLLIGIVLFYVFNS